MSVGDSPRSALSLQNVTLKCKIEQDQWKITNLVNFCPNTTICFATESNFLKTNAYFCKDIIYLTKFELTRPSWCRRWGIVFGKFTNNDLPSETFIFINYLFTYFSFIFYTQLCSFHLEIFPNKKKRRANKEITNNKWPSGIFFIRMIPTYLLTLNLFILVFN